MHFKRIAAAAAAVLAGGAAHAQTASGGTVAVSAPGTDTGVFEEIVVTAQRRQEELQTVPIAVTAITGDALRERNIQQAFDLQYAVPSLTVNSPYRDNITNLTLRGLPGVTTYFAEVPVNTTGGTSAGSLGLSANALFTDLANIQILKGPQGTLFGRNSTGGALLVQPRRPGDNFDGFFRGVLGSYWRREIEAAINVPVTEGLAIRLATNIQKQKGFTRQLVGPRLDDRNYQYFRASVLATPVDWLENYTVADYYRSNTNGTSSIPSAVNAAVIGAGLPAATGTAFRNAYLATVAQQQMLGVRTTPGQSPSVAPQRYQQLWKIINDTVITLSDTISLRNIASYNHVRERVREDSDGSVVPLLESTTPNGFYGRNGEIITEEAQVRARLFDIADIVAGGFYSTDRPDGEQIRYGISLGSLSVQNIDQRNSSRAAFVHSIFDLGSLLEGVKATAGFRHNWDRASQSNQQFNGAGVCTIVNPLLPAGTVPPGCTIPLRGRWEANGWTLGLDYQIAARKLVYFSAGRAYQPGRIGVIAKAQDPANQAALDAFQTVRPEYFTSLEVGLKADWRIGSQQLRTNIAAYRGKYTDIVKSIQVPFVIVDALGRPQPTTVQTNIAKATIQGVEAEISYRPIEPLTLTFNGSYTDAFYNQWVLSGVEIGKLNPFNFFPKWKWNAGARLRLPIPEQLGETSLGFDWNHNGRMSLSAAVITPTSPRSSLGNEPAYDVFNARIDWNGIGGSAVDGALFVTNLTNKVYRQGSLDVLSIRPLGFAANIYGDPRMYGVQLRYRFGASARR